MVFRVSSDLWVTDGTTQGTQLLSSNMPGITVRGGVRLGSFVYYLIDATSTDVALWRTDGTSVGTEQIAIIADASPRLENGFALSQLVAFGTNLAFVLDSDAHGEEVWVSEGSQATTQVLKDIIPGTVSSSPTGLVAVGNDLFFSALESGVGRVLWMSDGTPTNTVAVQAPGDVLGKNPEGLYSDGQKVYFSAVDAEGFNREPWVSDGTAAGTFLLKDLDGGITSSFPNDFRSVAGEVLFDSNVDNYQTDATSIGTVPNTADIVLLNDAAFFRSKQYAVGRVPNFGVELVTRDGVDENTTLVADLATGTADYSPESFGLANNLLFFRALNRLQVLTDLETIDSVTVTSSSSSAASFELRFGTTWSAVNVYAVCHDLASPITPTAQDIVAGRINASGMADSVATLSDHTLINSRATLTCAGLPTQASQYKVYAVFENTEAVGPLSETFSPGDAVVRTAPQITSVALINASASQLNFTANVTRAEGTSSLRLYYVCDSTDSNPSSANVYNGEVSDGVDAAYARSVNILSSAFNNNQAQVSMFCPVESASTYRVHVITDETALDDNSLSAVFTSAPANSLGEIGSLSFSSSSENTLFASVSSIRAISDTIDLYWVCNATEPAQPPSANDIKAGRIDGTNPASASDSLLSISTTGSKTLACDSLNHSKACFVYAVFEETSQANLFSEQRDWNFSDWRTAPFASGLQVSNVQAREIDFAGTVDFAAETDGVRIYWICDESAAVPTGLQIVNRRNASNSIADYSGYFSLPFTSAAEAQNTAFAFTCETLDPGTQYYAHSVAKKDSFHSSNVLQQSPTSSAAATIATIGSITQNGMDEFSLQLEVDSVATSASNINMYAICVDNGSNVEPSATDIKAGRLDDTTLADGFGQSLNQSVASNILEIDCTIGSPDGPQAFDVYAVIEEIDGEERSFSDIYSDTLAAWRSAPQAEIVESTTNEAGDLLADLRIESAAQTADLRVHFICSTSDEVPSAEDILAGNITTDKPAEIYLTRDLFSYASSYAAALQNLSCGIPLAGTTYRLYAVVDDLGFGGDSYQTVPASGSKEIVAEIEEDFCFPVSLANGAVLVCL